jgi:hypothetical protein
MVLDRPFPKTPQVATVQPDGLAIGDFEYRNRAEKVTYLRERLLGADSLPRALCGVFLAGTHALPYG